ncbi:MAG: LytR family transcriptional regulator [Ruminococcaceae bacterium]|nr:LytR family transcriptional regulator [Oscillospiraceae bacterium]
MNKKKFLTSFVITILAFCMILGGLFAATGGFSIRGISQIFSGMATEKSNILVMGLDKEARRADVIMVVGVDPKRNKVSVLSIPRDTRVEVGSGRYDKINHTMGYKNPEETIINSVEKLTGIPIDYYCEVTFEGFRNFIDILGGVEFDVPVDMHYEDPAQDLYIHVNKGLQVLNGEQAEGVVRFRNTYARADLQRIEVQQDFLMALFEQKLNVKYILKAPAIIEEMYESVNTNLSIRNALRYVGLLGDLTTESLSTDTLPGNPQMINGVSYVVPDKEALSDIVLTEFGYPEE